MTVFFDSSVHVDIFRGLLAMEEIRARAGQHPLRLSPVVAHELIRGARGSTAAAAERLVAALRPIEPPSWRKCFIEAARLVRQVFASHEDVGLARLQNDALLALTARHTGALFVARDAHFAAFRKRVPFALLLMP